MKDKRQLLKDKIYEAEMKANNLLKLHNLNDWKVEVNNYLDCIAETRHEIKTIVFNKKFIKMCTAEQFEGVTLHEITHALLGHSKGHGHEFKRLCKQISNSNEYARKGVMIPLGKYVGYCPGCNVAGCVETKDRLYCKKCFDRGKIVQFITKVNRIQLVSW